MGVSIQEATPELVEAEFQAISVQPAQHPDFDVPDTSEPSQDLPDQTSIASGAPAETFTPAVIMRSGLKVRRYQEFNEAITGDPRQVNEEWIAKRLVEIVAVEGPVIAKRACNIYLRAVGVKRMGNEIKATMAKALRIAISRNEIEALNGASDADIMQEPLRQSGSPPLVIRTRGDRLFEEITPGEIQFVARYTADKNGVAAGSEEHLRMVLEFFDLKRLTTQVGTSILEVMDRQLPHVDAALENLQSGEQV